MRRNAAMNRSISAGVPTDNTLGKRTSYAVSGDAVYVGAQDAFVIDVYSAGGQLVRSIRAPGTPLLAGPDLSAEWDAWLGVQQVVGYALGKE
jgi:hypothetical protein